MSNEVFKAMPSLDRKTVEIGMFDDQNVCHDCIRLSAEDAMAFVATVVNAVREVITA